MIPSPTQPGKNGEVKEPGRGGGGGKAERVTTTTMVVMVMVTASSPYTSLFQQP
jgi:hypothetical protein